MSLYPPHPGPSAPDPRTRTHTRPSHALVPVNTSLYQSVSRASSRSAAARHGGGAVRECGLVGVLAEVLEASSPISVTDDGMTTEANKLQPLKATCPIFVTDDGLTTDDHELQQPRGLAPVRDERARVADGQRHGPEQHLRRGRADACSKLVRWVRREDRSSTKRRHVSAVRRLSAECPHGAPTSAVDGRTAHACWAPPAEFGARGSAHAWHVLAIACDAPQSITTFVNTSHANMMRWSAGAAGPVVNSKTGSQQRAAQAQVCAGAGAAPGRRRRGYR